MSESEFKTECKDYQPTNGPLRKGCGAQIVMKKYPDGKWHPHNEDGTPHKHEKEAPKTATPSKTPPAGKSLPDKGYYEGIQEIAESTEVASVNNYLKAGWSILKIEKRDGFTLAAESFDVSMTQGPSKKLMAVSEIVYILGRRAE